MSKTTKWDTANRAFNREINRFSITQGANAWNYLLVVETHSDELTGELVCSERTAQDPWDETKPFPQVGHVGSGIPRTSVAGCGADNVIS